ncbi:MAG TPA: methyltransferase domain-containing protein [Burkholderiales bacterium]|nr:methyltransferase domain-containing protein [Burkholderiales bacterium]
MLEVGSGPIPSLGISHPTRRVEVIATDVLAKQYDRLLKWRGITPPVRAVYADMERLSSHFGSGVFDLVYASNCVDHTENALLAILEMVAVLRPGGHVIMDHMVDEGAQQDYAGLHRWNMNASDGRLLLWNERARHDIGQVLGASCEIRAGCTDGIVTAEIRRLA